ncbi:ABC transporter permease [Hydrogenophaga sp. Root209]|uniref:ABC transporter permease n=1 Tax=Hydrogenophaga sp. Root209 TaxID=1736490 RepID=UPI0009E6E8FB|nr:ABC transporter permease [Hydrogenophaga sp. Root209]
MASTITRAPNSGSQHSTHSQSGSKPNGLGEKFRIPVYQVLLVLGILLTWELLVRSGVAPVHLYGQPSGILEKGIALMREGELFVHIGVTAFEAIVGFAIGTTLGSALGLALWLSDTVARILRPLIVAINGVPKIALAPLVIVWFCVDMGAKVAIAASLAFIVALISVYQGTQEVDQDLVKPMRSLGARPLTIWRKVIVPGATPWILATMRLNIGFAMIGAVVGEYISAKKALGYFIYNAGALYDLNSVFVGIFCLMVLALVLDVVLLKVEARFKW